MTVRPDRAPAARPLNRTCLSFAAPPGSRAIASTIRASTGTSAAPAPASASLSSARTRWARSARAHRPSRRDRYRGRDESKEFWRKTQTIFDEIRWESRDLLDLGDAVVVDARIVARGRGGAVPIEVDETDVFWFRDGRLVRLQAFAERADALAAAERSA